MYVARDLYMYKLIMSSLYVKLPSNPVTPSAKGSHKGSVKQPCLVTSFAISSGARLRLQHLLLGTQANASRKLTFLVATL